MRLLRATTSALGVIALVLSIEPAGAAADMPAADKLMALMPSASCAMPALHQRMELVGATLVKDKRTRRVVIDWPLDPSHNVDPMGRASPIAAVIEVSAPGSALPTLGRKISANFGASCPAAIYFVHERRFLSNLRNWALGQPSPGSKLITTIIRKDGVSPAEFDDIWSGPHAKLTLGARAAAGEQGSHYVQNQVVGAEPGAPPLDGIGEGGSVGGGTVPIAQRMKTAEHAKSFMEMSKSTLFNSKEYILKD